MTNYPFTLIGYIFNEFKKDDGVTYTLNVEHTSLTYRGFKVVRLYEWKASINAGIRVVYDVKGEESEIILFRTDMENFGASNIMKFIFELNNG